MAEHRPYRVTNRRTQAQLAEVKVVSVASFLTMTLVINWIVTQRAAALFGYSPLLGPVLIGRLYAPWGWIAWWTRWHGVQEFAPVWKTCVREAGLPLLLAGALAAAAINMARWWLRDETPDLHGSARWADARDIRASGFLAPRRYLPGWLRRHLVRAGLLKPLKHRDGIYVGAWRVNGRLHYLRDSGQGHVLVFAPTRSGKGLSVIVPTLLTWRHSTLIHDLKDELWPLTAGARKSMGQLCLRFAPSLREHGLARFNPLAEVRLHTPREIRDIHNIVRMISDPYGKGPPSHWDRAGDAALTGFILHQLYEGRTPTLAGVEARLSDPEQGIQETIEEVMRAEHDSSGVMGWRDSRRNPTRTHPVVTRAMRSLLNKAEKERSAVISQIVELLALYRDPVVATNTAVSDFQINDLMNHHHPLSLYIHVPLADQESLTPLIRLVLSQVLHRLTERLDHRDGRAVPTGRHPLLMVIDEFPSLGRLELLAKSLSLIAGYGIRACLAAQDLTQIYEAYGRNESITSSCDTKVALTPNNIETAEELSKLIGSSSVRHAHRTVSGNGASVSESEVGRPLMTPEEVRRLGVDETLIFSRGHRPVRAALLRFYEQPYFKRRTTIKPPQASDRTVTELPTTYEPEKVKQAISIDGACISTHTDALENRTAGNGSDAAASNGDGTNQTMRFLKFATDPKKIEPRSVPIDENEQ
jgi:type IV secretion system protein VirD4